jgi:hypothetical protein
MRQAASTTRVGEEMKIGLTTQRSALAPMSGRSASAHQPRESPSQNSRNKTATSTPRMARSCST